jgi:hypothetical protein
MATPNFKPWVTDEDIEAQLRDEVTHDVPRVCLLEPQHMDPMDTQRAGELR